MIRRLADRGSGSVGDDRLGSDRLRFGSGRNEKGTDSSGAHSDGTTDHTTLVSKHLTLATASEQYAPTRLCANGCGGDSAPSGLQSHDETRDEKDEANMRERPEMMKERLTERMRTVKSNQSIGTLCYCVTFEATKMGVLFMIHERANTSSESRQTAVGWSRKLIETRDEK